MQIRFILVTHCNADCYFCLNEYVGTKSTSYLVAPKHYKQLMHEASKNGITSCTLSGGEPTLRRDLRDIVYSIKPYTKDITLVSNGYNLLKHVDAIAGITELHVSYHSMSDQEWERITKVPNGASRVRDVLIELRKLFPELIIKLNVVAEMQNSTFKEICKYVQLARELSLEVTVFRESCSDLFHELGMLKVPVSVCQAWDMKHFGGILLEETDRRLIYSLDSATIIVQKTSSESPTFQSLWITPLGHGFVDTRQRSNLINFMPYLEMEETAKIQEGFTSLLSEAELLRNCEMQDFQRKYDALLFKRNHNLQTAAPIPVSQLPLWNQ